MGPRSAVLGVADACGPRQWGFRWSSIWGHEALHWVWRTHAGTTTGAFGGVPFGATKRCTGCGGRLRTALLGPFVEPPMGPRSAVLGVADTCGHPHWGLRWGLLWGHEA
eukprot:560903-Pyramimonas_sp.AAC.1